MIKKNKNNIIKVCCSIFIFLFSFVLLATCDNPIVKNIQKDVQGRFPKILIEQGDTEISNGGTYTFTGIQEGYSGEVEFKIVNGGMVDLQLIGSTRIAVEGDEAFALTSTQPDLIIPPNQSTQFTVQFTPPDLESRTGNVIIKSNDPEKEEFSFTLSGNGEPIPVTGVSLNKSSSTINDGSSEQLEATVEPADATDKRVSWSSNNESVVSVDSSGLVTAITVGEATVTVTTKDGGFTATCAATIEPIQVTGVSLNKSSTTIVVGSTEQLTATVEPANATNKSVTWSSDNEPIATVDSNGLVTAESEGTATITVETSDGGFTAECVVSAQDLTRYYRDADEDGFGDPSDYIDALNPTTGYSCLNGMDCDDLNMNINPAMNEICGNGVDDDCDPQTSDVCP